jgi:Gpi18-like mannosyltransferase/predicted membrane-bound dolichyl-phosphate-mannose-protein mannosyltransferase
LTSIPARGVESVRAARERPLRALSATPALIILLLAALGLRLAIAYVFFPASGFASDIGTYVSWALTLAEHGAAGFYGHVSFIDYPPGYLLILWPIGVIGDALTPLAGGDTAAAVQALIKLPPIVIDLLVGFVLYRLVKGWARPRGWARAESMALAAAAIYLFNPVSWYDSALWGQTDAAGALVMLLGVAALIRGNAEGAAAMAVMAALVKPQYGIVMIPLVLFVLIRRHVVEPGSGPRHRPLIGGRIGAWLLLHQGPIRIVTTFVAAWGMFFLIALPFRMGPIEYLNVVFGSAGGYAYLSVNAYNPWALVGAGRASLASAGSWSPDTVALLGPLPGWAVGGVALVIGFLWALANAFLRPNRRTILVAAVVLSAAFFVLPTRVHERYLFPVFAFLPILAVFSRRWRWVTLAFAAGSFINLHAILTFGPNPQYGTNNVAHLAFGDLFRTFPLVALSVVLQTAAFAFAAWQLRPSAIDDELEELDELDEQDETADAPLGVGAREPGMLADEPGVTLGGRGIWDAPTPALALATGAAGSTPTALPDSIDSDRGWIGRPGIGTWLDAKLGTHRPVRRDRSDELAGERHGRWDRVDLIVVVLLTLGTLTLRGFHLEQPYDMYFDEVYHARTATEFLQHWRYGIVHSIYEYTHPHLAKYAMALGIEAFANNTVTGTTKLPQSVTDAAIEPSWSPASARGVRNGDRLYVADPTGIGVYDLATRERIGQIDMTIAPAAIAVDESAHVLYVAGVDMSVGRIDTKTLDALRTGSVTTLPPPEPVLALTGITGRVQQLSVADSRLVARTTDGWLASVDTSNNKQTGTLRLTGVADVERVPATDQVIVDPSAVTDAAAEAAILAKDLNEDVARIRALLTGIGTRVSISAYIDQTDRDTLQKDITAGSLPGVQIQSGPVVAVSDSKGVTFLDAIGLRTLAEVGFSGARGMAVLDRGLDVPTLYVAAAGSKLQSVPIRTTGPSLGSSLTMPGDVRDVVWNKPANLVHMLGDAPGGGPTLYVVEPHANPGAVFADAPLPFEPVRLLADTQAERPQADRTQILALAADGQLATVEIGQNAFAWRLPGVAMGTLLAVCVYLLARLLFRRRSVGLIAAVLVVSGGMFFANARIAMNDTYVTGFILAAVTLFAPLYLGIWRRKWQIAAGLVGVGLFLGLALASKWVALYAIGGLVLLVLLRSALGRILALGGMIAMTAVLGALAVRAPDIANPHINVLFLLLMLLLTVALAVAMVRRPVRMSMDELRFAVVAPAVVGLALVGAGLLLGSRLPKDGLISANRLALYGAGFLVLSASVYATAWLFGRLGRGPLAAPRSVPRDEPVPGPAPSGWLRPGRAAGLPWLLALMCLIVLPIAVYVVSYAPWVALGNQWFAGNPAGHTGTTFIDMQLQMYDYHNTLRAGHAAASPWWAWPLDLKPVWFYQHGFGDGTTGVIYDAENLVMIWLAIPAMAFAAWAAWRRRSLSLTLLVLLFAAMWLPWSRVDRASFQYHVFTSLPFAALALAYFLAELWHGPSPGTWLMARIAAAVAIIGPPLLWLGRQPLCLLSGSAAAHSAEGGSDGIACGAITRSTQVSEAALASVLILLLGLAVLGWQLWLLYRAGGAAAGPIRIGRVSIPAEAGPFATLVAIVVAVVVAIRIFSPDPVMDLKVGADEIALVGLAALAVPAWLVLHARDSRRFVLGVLTAVVLWFVAWFPNLSGLPMPNSIANIYQGLLPSWNYDFWFSVNKDELAKSSLAGPALAILVIVLVLVVVAIVATHWLRPEKPIATSPETELPESA